MATHTSFPVRSQGKILSQDAEAFGELRDSSAFAGDMEELRLRMAEDGYLFLRGFLDREEVLAARHDVLARAAREGVFVDGTDVMDGILNEDVRMSFRPDLTRNSAALARVLFDGPMMAFFGNYLESDISHFDYIWLRAISPGKGTPPHGDSVFMNRGTADLYTAWTPLGDIDRELGGLIVLEQSHKLDDIRNTYGQRDVDTYCEDDPNAEEYRTTGKWAWNGQLSDDPVELREQLGKRWLTADFRAGDLLVFTIYTLHASLDNQSSNRIRLSSDTRYQRASEPIDERWIGDDPIAHDPGGKKSIIC
jgi:hypothetical protein